MNAYDALANQIFGELTAVMGPLYSQHLGRSLSFGDIHDAVILATDEPGCDADRETHIIAAAPELLAAFEALMLDFNDLPGDGAGSFGTLLETAREAIAKAKGITL